MLDVNTRRRIDTARDILVGKLPDPKSQVEQITIALIYKFMDDMDREAVELGGKAKFFTGEYQRYAWTKIFDPSLSGYELVNVYGEAIQKMNQNPNIPQLFRDIFKNAFLPYRDTETLKSFLKIINDFEYDHSEKLGDAFEYLLSVLGSQGEAGQFRTPRHIIDFMVEIVDPKKNESILDPACGTAGFLVSSYKHILKHNSDNFDPEKDPYAFELHGVRLEEITINSKKYAGDRLTSDDRERLVRNIIGYDISPDMVRLSLVNMYLHGFSNPCIFEYDTLTNEEKWNEYADVIMANPPFMSPKGGIRPHKRFSIQSSRSEVLFVDYIAEHLTPHGRAAVIVPEGIIFQAQTAHANLRKMLIQKNYLAGVISLPPGVFNPYSGVKTSILWMDKTLARKTDNLLFAKIENDGFDLGAQRRPIRQNDLPNVFRAIQEYKESVDAGQDFDADKWQDILIVQKSRVTKNDAYNLTAERHKPMPAFGERKWPMVKLADLCEILNGYAFDSKNFDESEGFPVIRIRNIKTGCIDTKYDGPYDAGYIVKNGDLLIGMDGEFNSTIWKGGDALLNQRLCKLHDFDRILPEFLYYVLEKPLKQIENTTYAVTVKHISSKQIANIEIPLPPLEVQRRIVAEISGYQKIVDGARQVIDNYKPHIDINPSWPMVELKELCEIVRGASPRPKGDPRYYGGSIPRLMVADVTRDGMYSTPQIDFLTEEGAKLSRPMRKGDLIMAVSGQPGLCTILQVDACIHDGFAGFKDIDHSRILTEYAYYILMQLRSLHNQQSVGAIFQNLTTDQLRSFRIPVPSLKVQRQIVITMGNERKLVNANRSISDMFERKIKDCIAQVWGER